jgi:nicotinamidase/pyrazinamidase
MVHVSPAGRSALLLVDVQRDFCPGGALPVPEGDRVVPVLNGYIAAAHARRIPVYASRDWHPAVTSHFRPYGGPWPPHCVEGTPGAAFHPDLRLPPDAIVISKGRDPVRPGYSAFDGRTADGRTLLEDLRARRVEHLYVGGLATDYCVRASVLDARRVGLDTSVLIDGVAGIDAEPGDVTRALDEMRAAGAAFVTTADGPFARQPSGAPRSS